MTEENNYLHHIGFEEEEILLPIGVNLKCAKCEMGYLEVVDPNGTQVSNTLAIYPTPKTQYEHKCTNEECDNHTFLDDIYPRITYDNIENYLQSMGYTDES